MDGSFSTAITVREKGSTLRITIMGRVGDQSVFTGSRNGSGRRGKDKGSAAIRNVLLWKVAELQEGWDPLLEPSHYRSHQGRPRQGPQIYRVCMYVCMYVRLAHFLFIKQFLFGVMLIIESSPI